MSKLIFTRGEMRNYVNVLAIKDFSGINCTALQAIVHSHGQKPVLKFMAHTHNVCKLLPFKH